MVICMNSGRAAVLVVNFGQPQLLTRAEVLPALSF